MKPICTEICEREALQRALVWASEQLSQAIKARNRAVSYDARNAKGYHGNQVSILETVVAVLIKSLEE